MVQVTDDCRRCGKIGGTLKTEVTWGNCSEGNYIKLSKCVVLLHPSCAALVLNFETNANSIVYLEKD